MEIRLTTEDLETATRDYLNKLGLSFNNSDVAINITNNKTATIIITPKSESKNINDTPVSEVSNGNEEVPDETPVVSPNLFIKSV